MAKEEEAGSTLPQHFTKDDVFRLFGFVTADELKSFLQDCPRHYIRSYFAEIYLGSPDRANEIRSNNDKYLHNKIVQAIEAAGIAMKPEGKKGGKARLPKRTAQSSSCLQSRELTSPPEAPLQSSPHWAECSSMQELAVSAMSQHQSSPLLLSAGLPSIGELKMPPQAVLSGPVGDLAYQQLACQLGARMLAVLAASGNGAAAARAHPHTLSVQMPALMQYTAAATSQLPMTQLANSQLPQAWLNAPPALADAFGYQAAIQQLLDSNLVGGDKSRTLNGLDASPADSQQYLPSTAGGASAKGHGITLLGLEPGASSRAAAMGGGLGREQQHQTHSSRLRVQHWSPVEGQREPASQSSVSASEQQQGVCAQREERQKEGVGRGTWDDQSAEQKPDRTETPLSRVASRHHKLEVRSATAGKGRPGKRAHYELIARGPCLDEEDTASAGSHEPETTSAFLALLDAAQVAQQLER